MDGFLFTNGNSKTGYITKSDIWRCVKHIWFLRYRTIRNNTIQLHNLMTRNASRFYRMNRVSDCWFDLPSRNWKWFLFRVWLDKPRSPHTENGYLFRRLILCFIQMITESSRRNVKKSSWQTRLAGVRE
jgi:hypothetical protein